MLKNLLLKLKKSSKKKEEGQSLVEYGLILALVSVVAISILTALGSQINSTVNTINTVLNDVNTNINTTT
jgi:pilus assembly protein Flp/PilA